MFLSFFIIVLVFLADQLSKYAVDIWVSQPIKVTDFFDIIKVWNTGVSFSMFNNYGETGKYFLIAFALIVAAFLLHWLIKEKNRNKQICLAMIIGGALGNVADRIYTGAVMDFLDFHYLDLHWPAFNIADSFICIGATLLIFTEIFNKQKKGLKNAK